MAYVYVDAGYKDGIGSYGFVISKQDGGGFEVVGNGHFSCDSNNVAEYHAIYVALKEASARGYDNVIVRSDSELVIKQLNGEYQVRDEKLQKMFALIWPIMRKMASVKFEHISRDKNTIAHELASSALPNVEKAQTVISVDKPRKEESSGTRKTSKPRGKKRATKAKS